jgi:protein O-mannosyl-transferase
VPKPRPKVSPKQVPPAPRSFTNLYIALALFVLTLTVYSSVFHFDFVNFDDPDYVTNNAHVRAGITGDGIAWAFTSTEAANWFPLTRLSHMLDCQLFGLDAGSHHAVNLLIHALAALLLFVAFERATHSRWISAIIAFLFAIHPLHAESVAWVSERKDVLSAFFWCLALWLYVCYTERPGTGRFVAVMVAFVLGLMSKPMLVTFPFVLVLLDHWPLRRGWRLQEKLPLFVLSAAAASSTFLVQRGGGAVQRLGELPLGTRVENAIVSYGVYLLKTVWPSGLAVFYPYGEIPVWQVVAALVVLGGVTFAVRREPQLLVGWLWFLGTLVPVIGLVQVGAQSHADRYMYLPMIGLGIMLAAIKLPRRAMIGAAAVLGVAASATTWAQVRTWRDSETLFRHAIAVTGPNYVAEHNLGAALMEDRGTLAEALEHLQKAALLQPNSARIHTDLGSVLAKLGRYPEAIEQFDAALRIEPSIIIRANRAAALASMPGRLPEALNELSYATTVSRDAETLNNYGNALLKAGQLREASLQFQAALAEDRGFASAHKNLASTLAQMPGRLPEAIAEYEAALRLDSDDAETHANFGTALAAIGRVPDALTQFEMAAKLAPNNAEVQYNFGVALAGNPSRVGEAVSHLEAAVRLKPDYAEAHNNLGVVLAGMGRVPEAIQHWQQALRIRPDYEDAKANLAMAKGR